MGFPDPRVSMMRGAGDDGGTGDPHPLQAARKSARHPIPDIEEPSPQSQLLVEAVL